MSTQKKPKQFHAFVSDQPLLVESVERLSPLIKKEEVFISTTKQLVPACQELLPDIATQNFIVEPAARNTGPAVGLVAAFLQKRKEEAIIAALWADHHIGRPEEFRHVLAAAERFVTKNPDAVVTVGINPTEPAPGLGYIQMNAKSEAVDGQRIFKMKRFVEKPDYDTAKKYIASWQYLWNAGYFIFRAETMLKLFKKYAPKIYDGLMKIQAAQGTMREQKVLVQEFERFPSEPIDTLIAEKAAGDMYVIPADLEWSDIGSWSSLHDILANRYGSTVITKGHHVGHDDQNALIFANDKMIATVGLKDVIIVDTPDVLLVANKTRTQEIKELIEKLKAEGKHLYL
jgi:mannose-1-phosphate guanylyltransferase